MPCVFCLKRRQKCCFWCPFEVQYYCMNAGLGRDSPFKKRTERVPVPKSQPTTSCFSIFSALDVRERNKRGLEMIVDNIVSSFKPATGEHRMKGCPLLSTTISWFRHLPCMIRRVGPQSCNSFKKGRAMDLFFKIVSRLRI